MKAFSTKILISVTAVALLLFVTVGSTAAYLYIGTPNVTNTFQPSQVSCAVVENGTAYTGNVVSVSQKSNVTIKNTSNIPAYIRAAILVTWKSADGKVYAVQPQEGTDNDYTLQLNTTDWMQGTDGYYYYNSSVTANGSTTALITSATRIKESFVGSNNTQYYLSIEIVAEAIQADGMGVTSAQDAWAAALTN